MRVRLAVFGVLLALAAPAAVLAQSEDDEAALILYRSGRDRFKAGDLEGALADLKKAFLLKPNDYVRFYLGLAYAKLGRCADGKPFLVDLAGKVSGEQEEARTVALGGCLLDEVEAAIRSGDCPATWRILSSVPAAVPAPVAGRRDALAGRCEIERARRLKDEGKCKEALALLGAMPAIPDAKAGAERDALAADCRRLVAGFEPVTADQKAAYVLEQKGIALLDAGRPAEAAIPLEKALAVFDEPHIRLHAARARFQTLACTPALRHAEAAARELKEAKGEADHIREWCRTFDLPDDAPLSPKERAALLQRYRDASLAGDGEADALVATLEAWDHAKVRLRAGSLLLRAGRWADAAKVLEPLPGRLPEREAEVAADLERARFAAMDANDDARKMALFERYAAAKTDFEAGRDDEAAAALQPLHRNPMVSRILGIVRARKGECLAAGRDAATVRAAGLAAADLDAALDRCPAVAARLKAEQERRAAAAAAVARERVIRGRKAAGGVLVGLGAACIAAAGGMAGWYVLETKAQSSALDRYRATVEPAAIRSARGDATRARDRARIASGLGFGLAAAGAGLGAWGIVTLLRVESGLAPAPMVAPGAAGISLGGGF